MSTRPRQGVFDGDELPSAPGTYALVMRAMESLRPIVGSLGACELTPGMYVYVGSAHGPGGLRARVMRHLRADKPLHWHIDHLTACVAPSEVIWDTGEQRLECGWVRRLLTLPGAHTPIPGFGAGDCTARCPAHLVKLPETPDLARVLVALLG